MWRFEAQCFCARVRFSTSAEPMTAKYIGGEGSVADVMLFLAFFHRERM